MKQSGWVLPVVLGCATLWLISCDDPMRPGILQPAIIEIDTVSINSLPRQMDSTKFFYKEAYDWGMDVDCQRADSLAMWFDLVGLMPSDLWIPADPPVCLKPYRTWNYIYVLLERPNSFMQALGFDPSVGFDRCFWSWRHYKYIRNRKGA